MPRKLRYHPLFDCDVREAAYWYDRRSEGLGDAFVGCVEACVDQIRSDPERFVKLPDGCRYLRVKRFPYVVLFTLLDTELLLLGVLHTARSRSKWRERMPDE